MAKVQIQAQQVIFSNVGADLAKREDRFYGAFAYSQGMDLSLVREVSSILASGIPEDKTGFLYTEVPRHDDKVLIVREESHPKINGAERRTAHAFIISKTDFAEIHNDPFALIDALTNSSKFRSDPYKDPDYFNDGKPVPRDRVDDLPSTIEIECEDKAREAEGLGSVSPDAIIDYIKNKSHAKGLAIFDSKIDFNELYRAAMAGLSDDDRKKFKFKAYQDGRYTPTLENGNVLGLPYDKTSKALSLDKSKWHLVTFNELPQVVNRLKVPAIDASSPPPSPLKPPTPPKPDPAAMAAFLGSDAGRTSPPPAEPRKDLKSPNDTPFPGTPSLPLTAAAAPQFGPSAASSSMPNKPLRLQVSDGFRSQNILILLSVIPTKDNPPKYVVGVTVPENENENNKIVTALNEQTNQTFRASRPNDGSTNIVIVDKDRKPAYFRNLNEANAVLNNITLKAAARETDPADGPSAPPPVPPPAPAAAADRQAPEPTPVPVAEAPAPARPARARPGPPPAPATATPGRGLPTKPDLDRLLEAGGFKKNGNKTNDNDIYALKNLMISSPDGKTLQDKDILAAREVINLINEYPPDEDDDDDPFNQIKGLDLNPGSNPDRIWEYNRAIIAAARGDEYDLITISEVIDVGLFLLEDGIFSESKDTDGSINDQEKAAIRAFAEALKTDPDALGKPNQAILEKLVESLELDEMEREATKKRLQQLLTEGRALELALKLKDKAKLLKAEPSGPAAGEGVPGPDSPRFRSGAAESNTLANNDIVPIYNNLEIAWPPGRELSDLEKDVLKAMGLANRIKEVKGETIVGGLTEMQAAELALRLAGHANVQAIDSSPDKIVTQRLTDISLNPKPGLKLNQTNIDLYTIEANRALGRDLKAGYAKRVPINLGNGTDETLPEQAALSDGDTVTHPSSTTLLDPAQEQHLVSKGLEHLGFSSIVLDHQPDGSYKVKALGTSGGNEEFIIETKGLDEFIAKGKERIAAEDEERRAATTRTASPGDDAEPPAPTTAEPEHAPPAPTPDEGGGIGAKAVRFLGKAWKFINPGKSIVIDEGLNLVEIDGLIDGKDPVVEYIKDMYNTENIVSDGKGGYKVSYQDEHGAGIEKILSAAKVEKHREEYRKEGIEIIIRAKEEERLDQAIDNSNVVGLCTITRGEAGEYEIKGENMRGNPLKFSVTADQLRSGLDDLTNIIIEKVNAEAVARARAAARAGAAGKRRAAPKVSESPPAHPATVVVEDPHGPIPPISVVSNGTDPQAAADSDTRDPVIVGLEAEYNVKILEIKKGDYETIVFRYSDGNGGYYWHAVKEENIINFRKRGEAILAAGGGGGVTSVGETNGPDGKPPPTPATGKPETKQTTRSGKGA